MLSKKSMAALLLFGLLAAGLGQAQTEQTSGAFKVFRRSGVWYGQNITNKKSIDGYVVHVGGGELHANPTLINVGPVPLEYAPIRPGQTVEIPVKPTNQVDVPAVLFSDGTSVGRAVTVEGKDVVAEMFEFRRGIYNELRRWAEIFQDSDSARVQARFQSELKNVQIGGMPQGPEDSGRISAQHEVLNLSAEATQKGYAGADAVHYVSGELARRVAAAWKFSKGGMQQ